jgi:hypothetical protein
MAVVEYVSWAVLCRVQWLCSVLVFGFRQCTLPLMQMACFCMFELVHQHAIGQSGLEPVQAGMLLTRPHQAPAGQEGASSAVCCGMEH